MKNVWYEIIHDNGSIVTLDIREIQFVLDTDESVKIFFSGGNVLDFSGEHEKENARDAVVKWKKTMGVIYEN